MTEKPTFIDKLKNDYWVFSTAILGGIYLLVGLITLVVSEESGIPPYISYIFIGLSLVSLVFLFKASSTVDRLFMEGTEINATITSIHLWSRYPFFQLEYSHESTLIKKKVYVVRGKRVRQYQVNDTVTILINENKPKQAIIKTFYEN